MKTVHVDLGPRSYDILIGPGLLQELPLKLAEKKIEGRIFLVSNTEVYNFHGARLVSGLRAAGLQVTEIFIPDGEKYKNIHTVENIYTYLIAQRADRSSMIAALGGGVTGDVAGFVAATFLRGIKHIQIPTTLLAQVDSSVGGKTGVNHPHGKNMIGAFHQPCLVAVDPGTLETLPDREFRSGLYEVLKYGLIYDKDFFDYLDAHLGAILRRDPEVLTQVICRCCEIKAEITSKDERETDLRRVLNFGHTFGHALEVAGEFRLLTHGEAIAYGMQAAAELCCRLGLLGEDAGRRIRTVLGRVGPLPPIDHITVTELMEAMELDKKRRLGRKFFVVLHGIGKAEIQGEVEDSLVARVWQESLPISGK